MMKLFFSLLFTLSLVSCATTPRKDAVVFQTPLKLKKAEALKIKARARAAWSERHEKAKLQESMRLWEEFSRTNLADKETFRMLSHGYYHLADAHEEDVEVKKVLWEKGIIFGEKALLKNPAFEKLVREGSTFEEALFSLDQDDTASVYWLAANLGKWTRHSNTRTQLKMRETIKEYLNTVDRLTPDFYFGATDRFWGAYYAVAPRFFGKDLEKSEKFFKESLRKGPDYLGTKVLMAEVLFTAKGDQAAFKKTLEEVLATDVNIKKELTTENVLEQKKARILLKKMDELF